MKKKSLSILIAVAMTATTLLPAASVFADTTATATVAPVSTYGVEYEGQVQNIGWQAPVTTTGDASDITAAPIAGTVQQGLRVEALKVTGTNLPATASITYQGQVQNIGWQAPVTTTGNTDIASALIAGTVNKGLRVEGFKMTLNNLPGYAIAYQTQVQNKGWQTPVQTANGTDITAAALAGTQNQGLRLEALRIELVKTATEKTAEVTAIDAVTTAETSKTTTDITTAKTAVTAVQDTVENAALTARIAAINVPLAVSSVSAINGSQIQIKFTQAIDASTVINTVTGKAKAGVITLTAADASAHATSDIANLPASLSADGTTLTLTTVDKFAGNYTLDVAADLIYSADGTQTAGAYTSVVNASDTTRPTVTSITYSDAAHAVVKFSEPVQAGNVPVITRADGTAFTGATPIATIGTDASTYVVDLSALDVADRNQNLNVTFTGLEDASGNLLTPNPYVATVKYDNTNTTKATISGITVKGASSFDIKFSGALATLPVVSVAGTAVPVADVTQDTTDASIVHVTGFAAQTDLQNVAISGFAGLNLVTGTATTSVVNFSTSTTAPTVTSSAVQKINGVEYLVLNYNENVLVGAFGTPTGSYLNTTTSVTTPNITYINGGVTATSIVASQLLAYGATTSNQVKIDLSELASGAYSINLPAGFVTDAYANPSAAVSNVSFTRTSNSSLTAPTASIAVQTSNNKLEVAFDKNVDVASALNTSNYSVEGATITGAVLTSNGAGSANVELTLANDSNTYTGLHQVTINGVKSDAGVLQNAYSKAVSLTENVRPTITTAKLTGIDTITLTFSKSVSATLATDFDVYVGGVKLSTANVVNSTAAGTTLTITGTTFTAAQQAAGIVVKPSATNDVKDADSNALNFTSIGVN